MQVHLEHRFFHVLGHAEVLLEDLRQEGRLAVARDPELLDFTDGRDEVAHVVTVAFATPAVGALAALRAQVLGHLFLEDLLEDGLDALADASADVSARVFFKLVVVHGLASVASGLTHNLCYATVFCAACTGAEWRRGRERLGVRLWHLRLNRGAGPAERPEEAP